MKQNTQATTQLCTETLRTYADFIKHQVEMPDGTETAKGGAAKKEKTSAVA